MDITTPVLLWAQKRKLQPQKVLLSPNYEMLEIAATLEMLVYNEKITLYKARRHFVTIYPASNIPPVSFKSVFYLITDLTKEQLSNLI